MTRDRAVNNIPVTASAVTNDFIVNGNVTVTAFSYVKEYGVENKHKSQCTLSGVMLFML